MNHARLRRSLLVLAVCAACSSNVTPSAPPTSPPAAESAAPSASPTPTATATPGQPATPTPTPSPTPLATFSQTTTLGTVSLVVPAPLIPAGTTISIEEHPLQDAPRDVRDAGVRQAFHVLAPAELTFSSPVVVTLTMERQLFVRPDGSLAIAFMAIRSALGEWYWLGDASMVVNRDNVVLSGSTSTFGDLFVWDDGTNLVASANDLGERALGQLFAPVLTLVPPAGRVHPVQLVGEVGISVDPAELIAVGPPAVASLGRTLTCRSPGPFSATFSADLSGFGADNAFFASTLHVPTSGGRLSYVMTGNCVGVTAPPPPSTSPSSSP